MFASVMIKAVGLATSRTSPAIQFEAEKYAIHVVVKNADTLSATIKAQVSNNNADWMDHPDFSATLTGNFEAMWRDWAAHYRYVRVVYTRSAGSADVEVVFNAKGGVSNV